MRSDPVIDIHAHRECAPAMQLVASEAERLGRLPLATGSAATREVNRRQREQIRPKMESVELRLADMDQMGIDVQVVSLAPYQIYTWLSPDLGCEAARIANDDLAEAVSGHGDRLLGLGTVPLQDTTLAIEELDRCIESLGFRGVELTTHVEGEELSSPRLEPFWRRVAELGVLVFIHPAGFSHPDRLQDHYFVNVLGHPIEETLAVSRLVFDGVLDRHPSLQVVVAHGGGFLPVYAGRADHAYQAREDVRAGLARPPSEYLRLLHFDSVVFDPDQLGFLIGKYGAGKVVLGTDYPYDMGDSDPLGTLARVPGLGQEEHRAVAGANAVRLLRL